MKTQALPRPYNPVVHGSSSKGIRTLGGTTVRENLVPDVDATVVSGLRDADAVLLAN